VYSWVVIQRARRSRNYQPVFEDWLWHTILPTLAYLAFLVCAITLASRTLSSAFVIAGATLLLVYIGIHNAWDTVVYITTTDWGTVAPASSESAAAPPAKPDPGQP